MPEQILEIKKNQRLKAISAVKQYPGKTSKELSEITGLDRFMLARRLPECVDDVKKGDKRHCEIGRYLSLTWWVK